jgi:hypothetical protein
VSPFLAPWRRGRKPGSRTRSCHRVPCAGVPTRDLFSGACDMGSFRRRRCPAGYVCACSARSRSPCAHGPSREGQPWQQRGPRYAVPSATPWGGHGVPSFLCRGCRGLRLSPLARGAGSAVPRVLCCSPLALPLSVFRTPLRFAPGWGRSCLAVSRKPVGLPVCPTPLVCSRKPVVASLWCVTIMFAIRT